MFSDRIYFELAFSEVPKSVAEVWRILRGFLAINDALPECFEVSQIAGHDHGIRSTSYLELTPDEVGDLVVKQSLTGFRVETGHTSRSVGYHLIGRHLGCRIEFAAQAPSDWGRMIVQLMEMDPCVGAWQWRHRYQVWQWVNELRSGQYERRFGPLPPGYSRSIVKSDDGIGPDREFVDIALNPGRPKTLLPMVRFYPTAEMWLGPHFWRYAKCTKEDVLAADFFLEKRDTPHFLYLKSWPEPFTRPDGEQGRQQQRLWKLLFHEDCEWPPGSGGICDEPMYGPPELMPKEDSRKLEQ
jgi:hypothetical protein